MRASALTLTVALALTGCITHGWTYDPSADFNSYETWAWITDDAIMRTQIVVSGSVVPVNPVLESWVRNGVEMALHDRGWKKATSRDDADLIATFAIGARDESVNTGYGYGSSVTKTQGTLTIDFFDAKTKRAVWNGWATESVIAGKQVAPDRVQKIITAIMSNFPSRSQTPPADAS